MANVAVLLPDDRTIPGTVSVLDGGAVLAGPFPVLGKSDNQAAAEHQNPTRDPELDFGDTPLGDWHITAILPTGTADLPAHSYGPYGALDLEPVAGQCLRAYQNGRQGIWIHSGDPGLQYGGLRPTHGCLRLSNHSMQTLVALMRTLLPQGPVPMSVQSPAAPGNN